MDYFSKDFHTFENVAQLSRISFVTSLASKEYSLICFRGLAEVAHEYQDFCEAIPRCLYMYNGFGIFTCILKRLLNCAVDASCGECIMCEVAL